MIDCPDHNGPQWLAVRYLGCSPAAGIRKRLPAGWYVVRTCPCHHGTRVTLSLLSERRAERVMRIMLCASDTLGT